jgi:hypothetical protein
MVISVLARMGLLALSFVSYSQADQSDLAFEDGSAQSGPEIRRELRAEGVKRLPIPVAIEAIKPPFASDETKISLIENEPVKKELLSVERGCSRWEFYTKFRVEGFFGNNIRFLNDANNTCPALDRIIIPARHTLDFNLNYYYGKALEGEDIVTFKSTLRNKSNWGDEESIFSTGSESIKHIESVIGEHSHPILRHVIWIREMWLELALNPFFGCDHRHTFTLGFFPFQVGRGISLGSAYGVDPDLLGYYSSNAIDQFAPGFKLTGDFRKDYGVSYDLYVEIADNRSDTFENVNLKTKGQIFEGRFNQSRGFGALNYIVAGRLFWFPLDEEGQRLSFEPYALFDDEREQKIEFLGDAESKLGTIGLAMEAQLGDFEMGFDTSFNVGKQRVYGADRNVITEEIRQGVDTFVNSHVIATEGALPPDIPEQKAVFTPENQEIINSSQQAGECNGMQIGESALKNSPLRFTNSYNNIYKGAMFVGDMAYWFCDRTVRLAMTGGFATGDRNPNKDLFDPHDSDTDSDFKGFISLQELYSGVRVKSAFVLSGQGKIPRLLSFPSHEIEDRAPAMVSRFTNLIFVGGGLYFKIPTADRTWEINPNILSYWQYIATKLPKRAEKTIHTTHANKHLGVEFNLFVETTIVEDLKFFLVGAVFVPGKHFRDITGLPLSKAQEKFLDSTSGNGIKADRVPTVGHDPAVSLNVGIEYKF